MPEHPDGPAGEHLHAGNSTQQRCLPGSVWTDQPQQAAGTQRKGNIPHRNERPEFNACVVYDDNWRARVPGLVHWDK